MLAQDLRRAQDLSLSGALKYTINSLGNEVKLPISGYGIFINTDTDEDSKGYFMYADDCPQPSVTANFDQKYVPAGGYDVTTAGAVCGSGDIKVQQFSLEQGVYIQGFNNTVIGSSASIDFTPPNPSTTITHLSPSTHSIEIDLSLTDDPGQIKKVFVNTAGLIQVQ